MNLETVSYCLFVAVLALSIIVDVSAVYRNKGIMSTKDALRQYLLWVFIALAYGVYLFVAVGADTGLLYFAAYTTEVSLSIDNLFVFILIFSALKIEKNYIEKVLTIGIFLAILFRIVFIFIGIALIHQFEWILLVFAVFLIYTAFKMFFQKEEDTMNIKEGRLYKFLCTYLRFSEEDSKGKYRITVDGKKFFTGLSLAVLLIGISDIAFAMDSIPAVLAITTDKLVVYSSNIFAILGLRALYFILERAKDKFDYVQQGVALVLLFVGVKIFGAYFFPEFEISPLLSFLVILATIGGSILISYFYDKPE